MHQPTTVCRDYSRRSDLPVPAEPPQKIGEAIACCVVLAVCAAITVLLAVRAVGMP